MAKRRDRKAHERQTHYRLMRRIYKLCAQGEWRLRYARIRKNGRLCRGHGLSTNTVGFVDVEPQIIWVDHREDMLMTFVHECLHILMGDRYLNRHEAEEREVQRLEKLMKRNISARQAKRLHMHMANMLVATE